MGREGGREGGGMVMSSHNRSGMDRPKTELPANKDKVGQGQGIIIQREY